MASKRKSIVTFICEVGDIRTSASGATWYEMYIQTDASNNNRVVSFNVAKHGDFRIFAANKTPVAMVVDTKDNELRFNNACWVREARLTDISFPYKDFPPRIRQFEPQEIMTLGNAEQKTGCYVTVNVCVTFNQEPLIERNTRNGPALVKTNVILEDDSGTLVCDIYKNTFNQLQNGKSYQLTNLFISTYNKITSGISTRNTKVKPIDDVVNKAVGMLTLQSIMPNCVNVPLLKVFSVKDVQMIYICICGREIEVADGGKANNLKCLSTDCGATSPVKDLQQRLKASLFIEIDGSKQWVALADGSLLDHVDISNQITENITDQILSLNEMEVDFYEHNKTIKCIKKKINLQDIAEKTDNSSHNK